MFSGSVAGAVRFIEQRRSETHMANPTKTRRGRLMTLYGGIVLVAGLAVANHVNDKLSDYIFGYVILYTIWIHVYLSILIGTAADKRKCGFVGWIIVGCCLGPLIAWIPYLIFVSWRPIVSKPPEDAPLNELDV
jgi:hypothetical protein